MTSGPMPDVTGLDPATTERILSIRRDPGYATENVTPLTDEDRAALVSMGLGLLPPHQHDGYGWRGCALCRRVEAQRVSRVFPVTPA